MSFSIHNIQSNVSFFSHIIYIRFILPFLSHKIVQNTQQFTSPTKAKARRNIGQAQSKILIICSYAFFIKVRIYYQPYTSKTHFYPWIAIVLANEKNIYLRDFANIHIFHHLYLVIQVKRQCKWSLFFACLTK